MSNDHYVPQLYFRNFAPSRDGVPDCPERRSIRLINIDRRKYVPMASIKGQCKKAGFYDYMPGLEAALGQLEGLAASAIRRVIESNVPPEPGSADHEALAVFTVIQQSRTVTATENSNKLADRMFKVAYQSDPRLEGVGWPQCQMRSEYPVGIPLMIAVERASVAMQLGLQVFINETPEEFITSDTPVVAHNQYCEGVNHRGVLGWNCSGIQILFPVSPHHLIYFYDRRVYTAREKGVNGISRIVDLAEIRNLNAFQIVTARENIYFCSEAMVGTLLAQIEQLDSRRKLKRHITVQSSPVARADGTSELIHQFERMLPLRLCVSSVKVKRSMRRISLDRRAAMPRAPQRPAGSRPHVGTSAALQYAKKRCFAD